jgi:hypothetical protein
VLDYKRQIGVYQASLARGRGDELTETPASDFGWLLRRCHFSVASATRHERTIARLPTRAPLHTVGRSFDLLPAPSANVARALVLPSDGRH